MAVRVLLSDGSGLTAKQTSYLLGRQGHHVEVLAPKGLSLTRFTRYVRAVHPVAPYGPDPLGWLEELLRVWSAGQFDVLIPTQEQVAVLALSAVRLAESGVVTAVPSFDSLAAVQDKVTAFSTLDRLGLPQPAGRIVERAEVLATVAGLPRFVKLPIGTASSGVTLVRTRAEAMSLAALLDGRGVFDEGAVLVQAPVAGPLVMVQSVFERGRLVAFHACRRRGEGMGGGASHKRSVDLPDVRGHLARLGGSLGWHGALSADVIMGRLGPSIIDVNPRLVEPANAFASGVDLVAALVRLCDPASLASGSETRQAPVRGESAVTIGSGADEPAVGRPGTDTHQLLLAVLGAACGGRRRSIAGELAAAICHRGLYEDSVEELSPMAHDLRAALPVLAASVATLVVPSTYSWFAAGSVANYALTPAGWATIVAASLTSRSGSDQEGSGWPR